MKKEVKIWCNPGLFATGLILLVINLGICCIPFFFNLRYYTEADEIGVKWLAGVLGAAMQAGMIACLPRIAARVCLAEDGIRWWVPFKKTKQASWSKFPNVYCAGYWNGKNYRYLVLTNRYLTQEEQGQINQVPMSENLIKIRYRKGAFRRIKEILPPEYMNKHRAVLSKFEEKG